MHSRRLILCLIVLTLLATCLLAAAKLRATPKHDRVQVGIKVWDIDRILGKNDQFVIRPVSDDGTDPYGIAIMVGRGDWRTEEGHIVVSFAFQVSAEFATGEAA